MKANIGTTDRMVRLIIGLVLLVLALVPGLLGGGALVPWLAGIAGVVLVMTALLNFCPLYRILGVNTCGLPRK